MELSEILNFVANNGVAIVALFYMMITNNKTVQENTQVTRENAQVTREMSALLQNMNEFMKIRKE